LIPNLSGEGRDSTVGIGTGMGNTFDPRLAVLQVLPRHLAAEKGVVAQQEKKL